MVKSECIGLWQYVFHYCCCLVYNMLKFLLIAVFISYSINCSIDGWGAMLQVGRSRVRLPIRSLIILVHQIFPACNRNGHRKIYLGKSRLACKADWIIWDPFIWSWNYSTYNEDISYVNMEWIVVFRVLSWTPSSGIGVIRLRCIYSQWTSKPYLSWILCQLICLGMKLKER
jgi:hypothetical protein